MITIESMLFLQYAFGYRNKFVSVNSRQHPPDLLFFLSEERMNSSKMMPAILLHIACIKEEHLC